MSGEAWTRENLARRFVEVFKRDPREGYSSNFHAFLRKVSDSAQFLAEILPDSEKSGASMRAVPLGILPTIPEVIEKTTLQAAITHNTPLGINAAVAAALTSHYFVYQLGPKKALGEFIETHVEGEWADPWRGKVRSKGWMSVKAAISAIMHNDSLSKMLQYCIDYTGDVDTVATIALGAASNSPEVVQDLPQHLMDTLENRTYGRDYIIALDQQLMALKKSV